jgi:hypothetical protein
VKAALGAVRVDELGKVIVNPAGDESLSIAKRTAYAEMGGQRLANERALVGQAVKQLGEFRLDLEGDQGVASSLA